jgi:uncharacterized protein (TIGR00162 family)
MVCIDSEQYRPTLNNPILVEGLPGIGFVANLAVLHLIRELPADRFAEIRCSSFQDFAVTAEKGQMHYPLNELYCYKGKAGEPDLILLYGNTQALTTTGQYELCGKILDLSKELGCTSIISLGGLKREEAVKNPRLYFAATDKETAGELLEAGAKVIEGQIFGVAGLLVGIGRLRGFRGFCLLAETRGLYPDVVAAREVLKVVCKRLNLKVGFEGLDDTAKLTRHLLENFGLLERSSLKERKRESDFRWFI